MAPSHWTARLGFVIALTAPTGNLATNSSVDPAARTSAVAGLFLEPRHKNDSWPWTEHNASITVGEAARSGVEVVIMSNPVTETTGNALPAEFAAALSESEEPVGPLPGGWGEAAEAVEAGASWSWTSNDPLVFGTGWPLRSGNLVVVYHQTSPAAGRAILRSGFRPGRIGWCGGAIYFAKTAQATYTKASGPDSHRGFMIEAVVDVGRVLRLDHHCGDRNWSLQRLHEMHFDSIQFNPCDGDEVVIYSPSQVVSMRHIE